MPRSFSCNFSDVAEDCFVMNVEVTFNVSSTMALAISNQTCHIVVIGRKAERVIVASIGRNIRVLVRVHITHSFQDTVGAEA